MSNSAFPFLIAAFSAAASAVLSWFTHPVITRTYPSSDVDEHLRSESIRRAADWYADVQVVATSAISWIVAASSSELEWSSKVLWLAAFLHVVLLVRIITLPSWGYGTRWRRFAAQPFSYGAWVVFVLNAVAFMVAY